MTAQDDLVKWRCELSEAQRRQLGATPGWNCKDVKFFVGRISFDQLGPERAAALNAVQTALKLPPDQVDDADPGRPRCIETNAVFRNFLKSLPQAPAPRGAPVCGNAR